MKCKVLQLIYKCVSVAKGNNITTEQAKMKQKEHKENKRKYTNCYEREKIYMYMATVNGTRTQNIKKSSNKQNRQNNNGATD